MIESPILDEVREILQQRGVRDGVRESVVDFLQSRFGVLSADRLDQLSRIDDLERLRHLRVTAATCPSLDAFFAEVAGPNREKE